MQTVGEMWLVLRLTDSATAVGITTALQFTPMLFAGAWGGVLADRLSKRRLLAWTQSLMALPALTLWMLTMTGHVTVLVVMALVFVRGSVNAIDNPARQSFVMELVGRERVVNAVSLNSLIVQSARIIGPALAGIVIATVGIATCFLLNSLSFGAMLIALWRINPDELQPTHKTSREPGQLREALRYVKRTPELSIPLGVMAIVGTLSFNFQTILPLMARFAFHGSAGTYAALTSAMAVGAVGGALAVGTRRRVGPEVLALAALAFGVFGLAAAVAPSLGSEFARARRRGSRQRHLRGRHQLLAAACRRARDARTGDGALQRRVPRVDADRRPARRLAVGRDRTPQRACAGRDRGPRRRRGDLVALDRGVRPPRQRQSSCMTRRTSCEPVDQPLHVGRRCCAPRTTPASSRARPAGASAAARSDARRARRRPHVRGSRRCRADARRRARTR